jgi:hypothetical protein
MRNVPAALAVLAAVALGGSAWAQAQDPSTTIDPTIAGSDSFLQARPDLRWRRDGVEALQRGDHRVAQERFRRAARYGDKLSQAMIGEMLWNGRGIDRDRALAYAWMDLAAERNQRDLVLKREFYWSRLSPAEQARAVEKGTALYAAYGDDVATPRLEREMERARRNITGSRTGWIGPMTVQPRSRSLDLASREGEVFFDERYWEPSRD